MGNITESVEWTDNVYQIETTDPVIGGPAGIANQQAKHLANRTQFLRALINSFAGVVLPFAGSAAPSGFLLCAGQAVSRTTYAALFAIIGTTYGTGNGTTTFNLPDLRGRAVAGVDNMGGSAAGRLTTAAGGVNAATLGAAGGSSVHTLTQAQLPAVAPTFTGQPLPVHGHPFMASEQNTSNSDVNGGIMLDQAAPRLKPAFTGTPTTAQGQQIGGESAGTPSGVISNLGSGESHANVQPTIALNYIIKF